MSGFSETEFMVGTVGSSGAEVIFHLPSSMWFEFDSNGALGYHNNRTWQGDRPALFKAVKAFAEKHGVWPVRGFDMDIESRRVLHRESGIWFLFPWDYSGGVSYHDIQDWNGDRRLLQRKAVAFAVANGMPFHDVKCILPNTEQNGDG